RGRSAACVHLGARILSCAEPLASGVFSQLSQYDLAVAVSEVVRGRRRRVVARRRRASSSRVLRRVGSGALHMDALPWAVVVGSRESGLDQVHGGDIIRANVDEERLDSRHDFWVRLHGDDATIVLVRHNLIYAYGPLKE